MVANTQIILNDSQHTALIQYVKTVMENNQELRSSLRTSMIHVDKQYQRELDNTEEQRRAEAANKAGDSSRFQNITVPVVKPQVETATAYQASVFLTGIPMFAVVANADYIDEALQLETVIDHHATRGGWAREFNLFFRDGFKYNFSAIEIAWEQETVASLTTDPNFSVKEAKPTDVVFAGNKVKRLDPYNIFIDPSCNPTEVYKYGEYAGYTEFYSRIRFKKFLNDLPDKQKRDVEAFKSGLASISNDVTTANFFVPDINKNQPLNESTLDGTNWLKWAHLEDKAATIEYKDFYEVTTIYARIIPSEFSLKVPSKNTPQIWKLIVVNGSVIVYCERQTNAHNWIPILVGQPYEDGLGYQTKSLATDAEPFQSVTSAFMNSIIASRRRAISDRTLYDPSRVTAAQINNPNPSAKIPVRPAAYGKNIAEAVYPFPYREDQSVLGVQQIREVLSMSETLAGQNPARQGQFVKGNKTREEFNDIMGNSVSRDQMTSILYEAQVFTPLKHILKINILQYQGVDKLYSRQQEREVAIDPVKLRQATLEFKLSDGLTPSSKIMSADSFAVALQTMGSSPQIASGYNVTKLFSYLMKSQGADLRAFEKSQEQLAYEQAVQQWQQTVMMALEKGVPQDKLPEQPKPADFGYNPNPNAPTNNKEIATNGETTAQ